MLQENLNLHPHRNGRGGDSENKTKKQIGNCVYAGPLANSREYIKKRKSFLVCMVIPKASSSTTTRQSRERII